MGFFSNTTLGVMFLLLAFALTFLMFYLWKFPYDKSTHKSSAPRSLVLIHRSLGYAFLLIYLYMMWDMVPRLWSYQIELPARTVMHLSLGIAIGAVLFVKIMVVRFFKHLEARLVPFLGTSLLIFAVLLTGLALPYSAREAYLRMTAQDGQNFSDERLQRVRTYLPEIGFADEAGLDVLASSAGLADGRSVLTNKCTQCHDLRTILAKPRTPDNWRQTVSRMSNRATILTPISVTEQWQVTAYLVAISPTLRKTVSDRKSQKTDEVKAEKAVVLASTQIGDQAYDAAQAEKIFKLKCNQCHGDILVQNNPPTSKDAVVRLVTRMVNNGLAGSENELTSIMQYLSATYVKESDGSKKSNSAPATKTPGADESTEYKSDY